MQFYLPLTFISLLQQQVGCWFPVLQKTTLLSTHNSRTRCLQPVVGCVFRVEAEYHHQQIHHSHHHQLTELTAV